MSEEDQAAGCCGNWRKKKPNPGLFIAALVALALVFTVFAFAPTPPGTVSRNVEHNIDATPLIYPESERQPELERSLQEDLERARSQKEK